MTKHTEIFEMESATTNCLDLPHDVSDDYTAAIELSNSCREFYQKRVKATESFKETMGQKYPKAAPKRMTSIDKSMDTLRNEMASLMDQDLSLMKQLLTLNEAIEDLKVKRMYHVSKDSLRASSQELHASDWSVSETDMFGSDEDSDKVCERLSDMTITKLHSQPLTTPLSSKSDIKVIDDSAPLKVYHGPQSSIDSGYGDDLSFLKMYNGPIEVDL